MNTMRLAIAGVGMIAIGALVRGGSAEHSGDELARLSEQVSTIRKALADEQQSRAALQDQLEGLRAQLAQSALVTRAVPAPASIAAPIAVPPPVRVADPDGSPPVALDPQRLAAAGLSSSDVDHFRARVSAIQLERLYLRDQAQRGGWLDSPRFAIESARLDEDQAGLRREFGDELYDRMLFAEGRPNRVTVTEVLADSAADVAGIRPGDLIERYDEQLILAPEELGAATSAGRAGSQVEVVLQRDGETLRFFLPRGPIGVRIEPTSVAPSPVG